MGGLGGGRRPVPIEKQKNRLSTKKKAAHKAVPVVIGGPMGVMPTDVKDDAVAAAKWTALVKLFNGKEYITSSDGGILARYCLLCSEETALRKTLARLMSNDGDIKDILALNRSLDTKRGLIRSLEDRLYLNPLAKMRGLPAEPKSLVNNSVAVAAGFGDI